jgi:hypothetical protein
MSHLNALHKIIAYITQNWEKRGTFSWFPSHIHSRFNDKDNDNWETTREFKFKKITLSTTPVVAQLELESVELNLSHFSGQE